VSVTQTGHMHPSLWTAADDQSANQQIFAYSNRADAEHSVHVTCMRVQAKTKALSLHWRGVSPAACCSLRDSCIASPYRQVFQLLTTMQMVGNEESMNWQVPQLRNRNPHLLLLSTERERLLYCNWSLDCALSEILCTSVVAIWG
jgi:hypothetical protein